MLALASFLLFQIIEHLQTEFEEEYGPETVLHEAKKLDVHVASFADGEINCRVMDNVRGADVFIVQPICPPDVNKYLMELLIMVDALKRASARRITAVIPYYGYARQERKSQPRTPITAKLVADLLVTSGINRVLACDLHAPQIQGFFNIPVDHVMGLHFFVEHLRIKYAHVTDFSQDFVIVSPDVGGAERARRAAMMLGQSRDGNAATMPPIAIVDKRRAKANESTVMNVVGDVAGRTCIIMDDIVDTAGTLCKAADALKAEGATKIICCITHGVLSWDAVDKINRSESITQLVITDTIPTKAGVEIAEGPDGPKIEVVSTASWLANCIHTIHSEQSLKNVFEKTWARKV